MTDRFYFMLDEMTKLCAEDVSRHEAVDALKRLKKLESEKPTASQLSRGALAGGIVGVGSNLARGLVKGEVTEGLSEAMRAKGVGGKALALGKSLGRGLHNSAASAAGSATFGALMPVVRGHLDREAEKDKIREYLGREKGGKLRRASKKYLGV